MAENGDVIFYGDSAQERKSREPVPCVISPLELLESARTQFALLIEKGTITEKTLNTYVSERVHGVRIGGADIIFVDMAHDEPWDPIFKGYLQGATVVVPEYFGPDLARYKDIPTEWLTSKFEGFQRRKDRSWEIAKLCKEAGKTVATVDIAFNTLYMAEANLLRIAPLLTLPFLKLSGVQKEFVDRFWPIITIGSLWFVDQMFKRNSHGKGVFGHPAGDVFAHYVPDMEQARRLYLAEGLKHLASQYGSTTGDHHQIVVAWHGVHNSWTKKYLLSPHPIDHRALELWFKTVGVGLDFSLRQYEYKGGPIHPGWEQFSKERLHLS